MIEFRIKKNWNIISLICPLIHSFSSVEDKKDSNDDK